MPKPVKYTTNHKYTIVAYSPQWPLWYKKEAALLKKVFGASALDIQHVGSTAVPGMTAKPQLDILMQIKAVEEADAFNKQMSDVGYIAYGDALGKGGRLFSRWENEEKIVNLHIYQPESHAVWEYTALRDYLISHPQEAKDYATLKIELHKKYPKDYLKYREFKDPYINNLKKRISA